jgi:hypothetical protein
MNVVVVVCVCGRRGTYGRYDGGDKTSPAAEDCEKANDEFGHAQNQRNNKTPHHPSRNLLVRVQTLLQVVANHLLRARVLELPYAEGVEPEVGLRLGAPGDGLGARLLVFVAFAVGPETDLVEVLEILG